jgi:hypothetical protein
LQQEQVRGERVDVFHFSALTSDVGGTDDVKTGYDDNPGVNKKGDASK